MKTKTYKGMWTFTSSHHSLQAAEFTCRFITNRFASGLIRKIQARVTDIHTRNGHVYITARLGEIQLYYH